MPLGNTSGNGRLDGQTRLLLLVNGLFVTATMISGTFLGIYIWKATHNFVLLGWFTLLTHVFMAITFWVGGCWAKRGRSGTCLRIGIAVSACFYGIVLLLGKGAAHYVWLLGMVQGIAVGMFWLGFNVVYFEATDARNRDKFNGLTGVTGSLVGMAAPWASGYLISHMSGERGYRIMFMVSLGVFVAGVLVSFLLHNRKMEGRYEWGLPVRIWRIPDSPWRPVIGALIAQGFRETVFGVMIGLLVYIHTGSEMKLGNYSSITQIVAFVTFYAVGRWLKPRWRRIGMLVGTVAMTLVILPFFFGVNFTTLLVFGIGTSLFIPFFTIPMTSSVFDLIGTNEQSVRQRAEYVVLRELSLNAGRIVGMTVFIVTLSISKAPMVINWMMLLIGSAPMLSWLFMRGRLAPRLKQG
ncbi:MFS transporter [Cohnella sp. CFH 77786]|uniref:MFS transporter n=1 Tax=Cohnella sp. CFH 77786 TaxID=2662265 RepID=UPI001C608F60|nr:MFS transporter [Cohnella sp. CFH 77786]MBW5446027.1 MFS transporter [Cohnella sp. CFH 77786]